MERTALITGASKRIGRALSEHLAAKGWNIVIHFNSSEKPAKELEELLRGRYPNQQFYRVKANLQSVKKVEKLIPKVVSEFGNLHLLVNNASVFDSGYIVETELDLFDAQMNVNLKSPFFLMRDFAAYCEAGKIINFVDTRVTSNKTNFAAYSLSKKGLWEATKMAALEFGPKIRVNAIAPGVTLAPEDKDENYLQQLAQQIPMKKPGGVKPILKSVDFILENDHLTGQLLFADGGENLGQNV
ncbi:MAG: SDR family oxidoreductase [Prolixibacteraceae bacterium]|nr:SDR family oxidoreductase [Prolixibacteraceae bacterium]